jgi:hypothetical protein
MIKKRIFHFLIGASVFICAAFLLVGCTASGETEEEKAQLARRAYMSEVNQSMVLLGEKMDDFTDVVSRGDIVGMRAQADSAFRVIDDLEALDVPEGLTELHKEYVEGCRVLKDALSAYIDLYSEVQSATTDDPFDYTTYDSRLDEIKENYEKGITLLESADKKASEME